MAPYDWLFNPPPTDADDVDVIEPVDWSDQWDIIEDDPEGDELREMFNEIQRILNEVFGIDE